MNDKEYIEYLESLVFAQEEVLTRIDKMLGNRVDFEKCSKNQFMNLAKMMFAKIALIKNRL